MSDIRKQSDRMQASSAEEMAAPEEKKDGEDGLNEAKVKEPTKTDSIATKKKYTDWPIRDIKEPHDHDVLYGRGGGTNHHPGNKRYRKMVEERKIDYVNRKRLDKPLVALEIIREWRGQDPPGRFLKLDEKTGMWFDVGDKKAREKTSQALREKAPLIRKQQEEGRYKDDGFEGGSSDAEDEEEVTGKSTRFAEGTNLDETAKPVLARDHSLGREYIQPDEPMTLDGFSWREGAGEEGSMSEMLRTTSISSYGTQPMMPPPVYPPRMGSQSSLASIHPPTGDPYRYPSHGSMGPPPPPLPHPGSYEHATSGELHTRYPSWRYESWGSVPPPPVPSYGYAPPHTASWTQRDHSLGQNPLAHATVTQPAYPTEFDTQSGTWVPHTSAPPPPLHYYPPPPDNVNQHYRSGGGPPPMGGGYPQYATIHSHPEPVPPPYATAPNKPFHQPATSGPLPSSINVPQGGQTNRNSPPPTTLPSTSSTSPRQYSPRGERTARYSRPGEHPKSPSYQIDPIVASQWSGQDPREIALTLSGGSEEHDKFTNSPKPPSKIAREVPKPDIVKRATSNQNETIETKPNLSGPSVKRCALNRDNSMASNRLKEQYLPGYFDKEVNRLSANFEQSSLNSDAVSKPVPISKTERMSTIDTLDLMVRPAPLTSASRSSTIDALNIDFDDDDPLYKNFQAMDNADIDDIVTDLRQGVPRPSAITAAQRLTTTEFYTLVNEPLEDD